MLPEAGPKPFSSYAASVKVFTLQGTLRKTWFFMVGHLFHGAQDLGLARMPAPCRTPGGHSHSLLWEWHFLEGYKEVLG